MEDKLLLFVFALGGLTTVALIVGVIYAKRGWTYTSGLIKTWWADAGAELKQAVSAIETRVSALEAAVKPPAAVQAAPSQQQPAPAVQAAAPAGATSDARA